MAKEMLNTKAFVANAYDEYWAEKYRKIRQAGEEKWKRYEKEEEEERRKAEAKKKKREEEVQVRTVKEVPEFEIKVDVEAVKVPEKCMNCDSLIKQNNELLHNIKRLKESYDTLNREMNKYTESNSEQVVAMNKLKGAYMRQLDDVNYYTEKCAELELKIYPIVERLKTFEEEKTSEEKKSKTKEEDEVEISGKSSEAEKEQAFRKQTNQEFLAKKQEEVKKSVAQKKIETRTYFQCKTAGQEQQPQAPQAQWQQQSFRECFQYSTKDHYERHYPQLNWNQNQNHDHGSRNGNGVSNGGNNGNNDAHDRVSGMDQGDARDDLNVIVGKLLLVDSYVTILFDSGVNTNYLSLKLAE
ncbi:golgin subfamily A member 6-like protein 1 [Helianthus annuus]|uniref:golgin subfamily A member 6-like protein 1 n=1 Tax=Helianthus annuus TaxID=4232 RepID=UPI001653118C|nr:golgin subfamily A member 6-like protein 1 [Helianthus annuus]